jgi:PAS domain S-box-containing protein
VREPLLVLDADLRVRLASRSFYRVFQTTPGETEGQLIYELGNGQWDILSLRKLLDDLLPANGNFDDYLVEHDFPGVGSRTMLLNARRLHDGDDTSKLILLAFEDITERRKLQLENDVQRKWLHVMLSSIGDAVIATDADARVTFLNPTAERMTGWTAEQARGQPLHEVFNIVNEETRLLVESPVSKAIRMGAIVGLANHTLLIARDGTERPIDDSAAPIHDDDGKVDGVVMVFHDITERRQAEAALQESEQRNRQALDAADMGTWRADLRANTGTRDANLNRILGLKAIQTTQAIEDCFRLVHPEDKPAAIAAWQKCVQTRGVYEAEFRIIRDDGSLAWLREYGRFTPAFPESGQPDRVTGITVDITRRKRAEEAIQRSESRYRRLFEAAHDGILVLNVKDRRIADVNPFMLDLLGYPREYFIGKELWEIGVFTDKAESQAALQKVKETGSIRFEDKPLLDRNGRRHDVEIVANIYQEDHSPVIQCNIRDISERKRFEDEREAHLHNEQLLRMEAETANRAKDLFLATLSHEMRTPLNAIVGWMGILRREGCNAADFQEGLEVIQRNTTAQVQLIEDVLDVSRIVSGKLRLEIKPCELIESIHAGVEVVRPAAEARDITLTMQLDPAASRASCDAARVQQVVWNLVSNAVKFTPKGGQVRITLDREQSNVRIAVTDSGQGMSPELLPFVFDRFRQADSSTRRRFGGLGLGLSIVKHIVEMHGGTAEAASEGPGRGSIFTIRLPIRAVRVDEDGDEESPDAERSATAASAVAQGVVRLDGVRVLVVDDEADARRLVTRVLEDAGANVTAAASAAEALDVLAKSPPHILVSDLGMPDEDGFDLIRQVRARGHSVKDLPAVALTAFVHKEDQRRTLLAGFQIHIAKPVDPHDLTAVVASLSGRTGLS